MLIKTPIAGVLKKYNDAPKGAVYVKDVKKSISP